MRYPTWYLCYIDAHNMLKIQFFIAKKVLRWCTADGYPVSVDRDCPVPHPAKKTELRTREGERKISAKSSDGNKEDIAVEGRYFFAGFYKN